MDKNMFAGWCAFQLHFIFRIRTKGYYGAGQQQWVNQHLSSLRPEITAEIVMDADRLFPPGIAKLVKQYKEDWDGS